MRILIIEDEKLIASNLQRWFKEKGYAVDVAYTGEEGEGLAEDAYFDVIILDIIFYREDGTRGKDGIQVCRSLRQKNAGPLIIMLTCKDTVNDRVMGLDSGADDYLVKPFKFIELEARVRAALRRKRRLDTPVIKTGKLVMDTVARRIWWDGKEIYLANKEYAIFEILVHYDGQVVPRSLIEQHGWNMELDISSNLVDAYICKLRAKFGQEGSTGMIQTVKGSGYRLNIV
jgi:two-component system copper resistance phosphate regulon response regulator CusR